MAVHEKNSESYSDECDRLSEAEISNEYTSWGRWFINDGMLSTWVCLPDENKYKVKTTSLYQFSVEKCLSPESQVEILTQVAELDFIGAQGIKDLARAFKYLTKHNKNVDGG